MKQVVHIIEVISNLVSGRFSAYVVLAMMALVLVEVLTRYVLKSPLKLSDEIGAYMVVAVVFLGLGYTWKESGHIRIEFVVSYLSTRVRNWLRLITLILATAFAPVLIKASYDFITYTARVSEKSESWLRTPLLWPRLALLIGAILLFLQLIAEIIKQVRLLRSPEGKT